jgi:eukaryotic-like serine/threonine-protein kinase
MMTAREADHISAGQTDAGHTEVGQTDTGQIPAGRMLAGRYRLDTVIGRGGMGAVWRARDELLNRDVAVKEIVWPEHLAAAERETAQRRAIREAQLAARLSHPNVVGVYDILDEDSGPCIVMELVPFRSLRDAVAEDGPMSPAEAARVGLNVLAALRAVHEAGVVHRDVKPANILLGPEGRVVLTDFGIAKAADSPALTVSGVLLGSPSYLSPECARGGRAGPAADMWALGASLYAAVEGGPPFERDGVLASLTAVVADELEPAPHAGPLWPVIEGLLRKDPAARLGAGQTEQLLRRIVPDDTPGSVAEPVSPTAPDAAATATDDAAAPATDDAAPPATDDAAAPATDDAPAPATDDAPGVGATRGIRVGAARRARRLAPLTAAAAAAVIAAGVALALTWPPGHHAAPRAGAGTPTASRSAPGTSAPPSSSRPATSAPPSSSRPASSAPPSSPGPSAAAPATPGSAVPSGYYRFTNSTGFSIGVPRGWQISHDGHYVYIRDPGNSGIFLLIDQSDQPKPDPLADWRQQAANRQGSYPGYHLIQLRTVGYSQAEKAADWEFTYDRNGVTVHVLNRNILANARHAYALYWSTPASDWNAYYHFFRVFAATFQPAPAS